MTEQANSNGNLPAPIVDGMKLATAEEFFAQTPARMFTTLDLSTEEGKANAMIFMQSGVALNLADHVNQPIDVEHIIAHSVTFVDDDGAEVTADRVVLLSPADKDGNITAYAAVSVGIRKSLHTIFTMYGLPPYAPARKFKAMQVQTRRKFKALTLVPVISAKVVNAEATKATAKK